MTPPAFAAHLRRIADEIEKSDFLAELQSVQAAGDDTTVVVGFRFKQGGCALIERINCPKKKG